MKTQNLEAVFPEFVKNLEERERELRKELTRSRRDRSIAEEKIYFVGNRDNNGANVYMISRTVPGPYGKGTPVISTVGRISTRRLLSGPYFDRNSVSPLAKQLYGIDLPEELI